MNVENMKATVAALKAADPEHFNMSNYDCGSAACLAGFAFKVKSGEVKFTKYIDPSYQPDRNREIHASAGKFLDLDDEQSDELFVALSYDRKGSRGGWPSRALAIAHLEAMIKTGRFRKWSTTMRTFSG